MASCHTETCLPIGEGIEAAVALLDMNVATDACIVINLLHVNRLDLLGALAPYVFYVPFEVVEEVEYPDQQQAVQEAEHGWILQTRLEDPLELQTFARATGQLGKGESACIALAEKRGWVLGTDDSKGIK